MMNTYEIGNFRDDNLTWDELWMLNDYHTELYYDWMNSMLEESYFEI